MTLKYHGEGRNSAKLQTAADRLPALRPVPRNTMYRTPNLKPLAISICLLSVLFSLFLSLGLYLWLIIVGVGAACIALIFLPRGTFYFLAAIFSITFLVQGTLASFLGFSQANWLTYGMAIMLYLRCIVNVIRSPHRSEFGFNLTALAFLGYIVIFLFSAIINQPPFDQLISSVKNSLPVFSVILAIVSYETDERDIFNLWRFILVVTLIQVPFAVYQHFFVAPDRAGPGWDSVTGTFGGSLYGGGASATLELIVVVGLLYSLALRQSGRSSQLLLISVGLAVLAVTLLGEVKAVFFWLPLGLIFVVGPTLLKTPLRAILYSTVLLMGLSATYLVYQNLYWVKKDSSKSTSSPLLGGYFFDPKSIDFRTGEVGRVASIALWAIDGPAGHHRVLGFGPGASKSNGSLGQGTVAKRLRPLSIDSTTIAVMLWDTGVLGAAAYTLGLVSGFLAGVRSLSTRAMTPLTRAGVQTSVATIAIMITFLIYNRSLIDEPSTQLLAMFSLGQIMRARSLPWNPEENSLKRAKASNA